MRVLLTGANGFIGSHLLDRLVESGSDVAILLRRTSDTSFIEGHLACVDVRYGSLESADSLREACRDANVVIHCAAKTKAVRTREYYEVNAHGTRNVVAACNASDSVEQLILVSSLAVSGPGTPESPASEEAEPQPVSHYGKSKALAERHVRQDSRVPYTILRPAAVYGPRDGDIYLAFKTIQRGLMPLIGGGRQPLSLICVGDVVEGVLKSIGRASALGGTYHLAHPVPLTQRAFLGEVAQAMGAKPLRIAVPTAALYPLCLVRDLWSRITSKPSIMNLQKVSECRAPGWVCSTARAAQDLDFVAATSLEQGVRLTLKWYRENGWL
ncbi:MAG: NAD-dependent epimerase/dehydratase family protein [Planctomycetota bacterium]|jgi:nucleoside-diphosphate-sugar epimerase